MITKQKLNSAIKIIHKIMLNNSFIELKKRIKCYFDKCQKDFLHEQLLTVIEKNTILTKLLVVLITKLA